jgi:RND superfamily putative drug exporter
VSLFGAWNWKLPDAVARILRIQPSHSHAEPSVALDD